MSVNTNRKQFSLSDLSSKTVDEHLKNINEIGFTILRKTTPLDLCDRVISSYQDYLSQDPGYSNQNINPKTGLHKRLINFHLTSNAAFNIFDKNQFLLEIIDSFWSKRETCVYTSLYFEEGTQQPIHRDAPLFCTFPENLFLGVWFALEDANTSNGALNVVPYGHHLSHDEYSVRKKIAESLNVWDKDVPFIHNELWLKYQDWVSKDIHSKDLEVHRIDVNKGDIVIWHPMLPHGGSYIDSPGLTRHSIVMHVTPLNVQVHGSYLFFNMQRLFEPRSMSYVTHEDCCRKMMESAVSFQ